MKKLSSFYNRYKEYLPLFSLAPIIIGGFWQILELAFISPAYIRFFSVSQLIPDGLVILFIFSILGAIFYILYSTFEISDLEELIDSNQKKSYLPRVFITRLIFLLILLYSIGPSIVKFFGEIYEVGFGDIALVFFCIIFMGLFIVNVILACLAIQVKYGIVKLDSVNNFIKHSVSFSLRILRFLFFVSPFFLFPYIHEVFYFPKDSTNLRKLTNEYSLDMKVPRDSIEVLYNNDKYIFLKVKKDVEILRFEELFEKKSKNKEVESK